MSKKWEMSVFCAHMYQKWVQNSRVAPERYISRAGFPKGERSPLGERKFFFKILPWNWFWRVSGARIKHKYSFLFFKKTLPRIVFRGFLSDKLINPPNFQIGFFAQAEHWIVYFEDTDVLPVWKQVLPSSWTLKQDKSENFTHVLTTKLSIS